jgi:Homeodomain-like domain
MRRRKPKTIKLPRADQNEIERVLDDGRTEQRVVRRGQILLAMKNPKTVIQELCQREGMTRIGIWYLCRRYETMGVEAIYDAPRSGRPREISALERVSIEQLACSEPSGVGLEMTHWSTRSLAKIAMKRGLVSHIAHSTVSLILRNADLQPHRSRYWITPTLNPDFLQQAGRILWLV